jgi:hypothetical protein
MHTLEVPDVLGARTDLGVRTQQRQTSLVIQLYSVETDVIVVTMRCIEVESEHETTRHRDRLILLEHM